MSPLEGVRNSETIPASKIRYYYIAKIFCNLFAIFDVD